MSFDANSPELRDSGRVAELALKLGRPHSRLTSVNWCMVQDHLLSFGPHRSLTDFPKRIWISTQKILCRHFKVFKTFTHFVRRLPSEHSDQRSFLLYGGMMKPMKLCMTADTMHSCHFFKGKISSIPWLLCRRPAFENIKTATVHSCCT